MTLPRRALDRLAMGVLRIGLAAVCAVDGRMNRVDDRTKDRVR